jgi:hypothetical protein
MDMGYSLAKHVKPKDTENIEEKEIVKNEMCNSSCPSRRWCQVSKEGVVATTYIY